MSRTFYDTATGRILARSKSGHGGPPVDDSVGAVDGWFDPATTYCPGGVPTARAVINYTQDKTEIVAAGGEVMTVTGLPTGSIIYFGAAEFASEAGGFTFDAMSIGVFTFVIDEPEYLKTIIQIEAI
jgi:hypothetical protein